MSHLIYLPFFICVHVIVITKLFFDFLCFRHQRINNVIEHYNREFGGKFTTGSPNLFVFCDVIQAEAQKWIQRYEEAKSGTFLVDRTERK